MTSQIKVFPEDSEENVQQMWYDRIGKFLGFPQSGSKALWTKNADRFGGQGTFIVRVFPNVNYRTIAWNGFTGGDGLKSSESFPLMTRTIGRTNTNLVFFAGVYGWKEALRSYNEAGGTFVNRNDKLEDLISAYKLVNSDIEPDPVPEGQTRLEDYDEDVSWAKDEMERFKKPVTDEGELVISDQEKRMQLMQLMHDLAPEDLFNQTQNTMISAHKDKWILTVIAPPKQGQGNIHFPKYMSDGFVPFMEYSEKLIKYLDRQANYGHENFNKINYYFKKIAEKGDFADQDSDAKWYVRPPDNLKNILEMFGAYERLPLQKTFFSPIKKSTVNWRNILKSKMAPSQPPKDDEEEKNKTRDKFTTNKWGRKIINPNYRRTGDTFIIDGEEVTEGTWKDTPLGQRLGVTSNWEDSCCQELKESLIKLLIVEVKNANKDIHKDKIRQTVTSMHCSELSEYMEPPDVDQNNFHNLQFFGIKIGDISQQVFMEALDLSGDIHQTLYEKYIHCLDYNVQWGVKKPPSETTDPVKDRVDVESGDVIVEREVPKHREFENFTYDTNIKPGKITDDEKSLTEIQREAVIHGKRKDMDDPKFQEDLMVQPMQEKWWQQQQAERNKPSKEKFDKLWVHGIRAIQNHNRNTNATTQITSQNVKVRIRWADATLMENLNFTNVEWNYTFDNWEELHNEYIRGV